MTFVVVEPLQVVALLWFLAFGTIPCSRRLFGALVLRIHYANLGTYFLNVKGLRYTDPGALVLHIHHAKLGIYFLGLKGLSKTDPGDLILRIHFANLEPVF